MPKKITIPNLKKQLRKDIKSTKLNFNFYSQMVKGKGILGNEKYNFKMSDINKDNKDFYIGFNNFLQTSREWDFVQKRANKLATKIQQAWKDYKAFYAVDGFGNIARVETKNRPLIAKAFDYDPKIKPRPGLKLNDDYEVEFKQSLDATQEYWLRVKVKCQVTWSLEPVKKELETTAKIRPIDLSKENIHQWVIDHFSIDIDTPVTVTDVIILSAKTGQKMKLENMELKKADPTLLTNLYNQIVPISNGKCIQKHLNTIYPKFSKKEIAALKTTKDIKNYCIKHNIKLIAYDIKGRVIASNYPKKPNPSRKALVYIAYNNHIYPLANQTLKKVVHENTIPTFCSNLKERFIKLYEKEGLPANVVIRGDDIVSFVSGGKLYHSNNEYDKCLNILSKFGLEDQMTVYTKISNIGEIIQKLYIKSNIDSFMPGSDKLNKGAFNYNNEEEVVNNCEEEENIDDDIVTIDKNKCYSSVLASLPYLIHCDQKQDEVIKFPFGDKFISKYRNNKNVNFIDEYLYIVEPKLSTILVPHKNIYSGEHLKYAFEEGVEFKVLELQEARQTENYYKQMVIDCYDKLDNYDFKELMNPLIGRFESSSTIRHGYAVDHIGNTEKALCHDGHKVKIDHDIFAILKETTSYNLFNKKPIAIQVKDGSRVALYKMMKNLGLETKDIIQIKTDSITFYNKPELNKQNRYKQFINDDLEGWKIETYKPINASTLSNINPNMTFILESDENQNLLCDCYAGAGKTHKIKNEILPKEPNSIVTTPSHATLKDYRKLGVPCDVIQKFTFFNEIPEADTIIVDEVGMIDGKAWNLLYKCKLLGKKIMCYGDRNQLLPVGSDKSFFAENWVNYFFTKFETLDTNYRNDFTKEYYDALIQSQDKFLMTKEIKKYNAENYWDADVIIAYRQCVRQKYNALMCDKLGIQSKTDIGAKLICETNKLRKKGVYNKFTFEVVSNIKGLVGLTDGQEHFSFTTEEINKHFDYAYCRTLYSIQGESRPSFYYAEEDLKHYQPWITGRSTYTLISRLKTKNL